MSVEVKVPSVGESVTEVQIGTWYKKEGDYVKQDENIVSVESDKASLDIPAPAAGVLQKLLKQEGDSAEVDEVIATIDEKAPAPKQQASAGKPEAKKDGKKAPATDGNSSPAPKPATTTTTEAPWATPSARRLLREYGLSESDIHTSGRIQEQDVLKFLDKRANQPPEPDTEEQTPPEEEVVAMSPLRRRIAERLVEVQQTAALLTTFNEIDMSAVKQFRSQFQDSFVKKHDVKLGFLSFFVKAVVQALKEIPELNAEIRGTDIVLRRYYNIGIAVSTERGLVVPVLRDADKLSFADIEKQINDLATRARGGKLTMSDFRGGTFSITNGGIFGSLLSTPIVNPPQSGILGMHAIQDRPVAVNGEVVIRPMMYVALTYDHRIVDGREAVTFLKRVKEMVEEPTRLMFEV